MKAKTTIKSRGRPRSDLRDWYGTTLPKMKPVRTKGTKEITVSLPEVGDITMEIPKGFVLIPPVFTEGKSQATIGQTGRNEAKTLNLRDRKFIVHSIPAEVEVKQGRIKEKVAFTVYAVEAT